MNKQHFKLSVVNTGYIEKMYDKIKNNIIDISNTGLFSFDKIPINQYNNRRKILILEDEFFVWFPIAKLAEKFNFGWDLITSNNTYPGFNINKYDYIFVDRDNELSIKNYNDFHTFIFEQKSLNLNIVNKIIPISGSELNNINLRNKIVNIRMNKESKKYKNMDGKTILKLQTDYESIINKKTFTKSLPDFLYKIENFFYSIN